MEQTKFLFFRFHLFDRDHENRNLQKNPRSIYNANKFDNGISEILQENFYCQVNSKLYDYPITIKTIIS